MAKTTTVDQYLEVGCGRCPLGGTSDCKVHNWDEELAVLRAILLETELTEEVKWRVPTYTYDGKNVSIMSALKDACTLSFFKGVLLKDPENILEKPGPNTQSDRIIRFTDVQQIKDMEDTIKAYIKEAIEVEKAGLEVEYKDVSQYDIPDEFLEALEDSRELQEAFESLTPGRQKGYLLHFSGAKQSKTRKSRIEKCIPKILDGKGFHDR